jgi:hypothetical protein
MDKMNRQIGARGLSSAALRRVDGSSTGFKLAILAVCQSVRPCQSHQIKPNQSIEKANGSHRQGQNRPPPTPFLDLSLRAEQFTNENSGV